MRTLFVFGRPVMVSDALEAYNQYRKMFQEEADLAKARFYSLYQQNNSLDAVIANAPNQLHQSISPAVDACVKVLVEHNILTVDAARLEAQYPEIRDIWCEPYLKLYDHYAEIVLGQEELDRYRVARRESRARWSGGGFGLSGALQGAAMAGALNLVSGAGHMVFNGLGKIVSSISASSQKNQIFEDRETVENLAEGAWKAAFYLHFALIDCLAQTGADTLPASGVISQDAEKNAAAILNNARQMADPEQCRSAMIQSIQENPYQEDWYRFSLQQFGDQDGTLEKTAYYFGIKTIRAEKWRQLDEFAKTFPLDTEEQALSAAQRVEQFKERIHCIDNSHYSRAITEAVERFDEQYRMVDGEVLPSREAADLARKELSEITDVEKEIDFSNPTSIAQAEDRLRTYSSSAAQQRRETLHQKWAELDNQLRTVSTLLPGGKSIRCKTYQQAEDLRPKAEDLKRRLDNCGEGAGSEAALMSLKSALETEALSSVLTNCYRDEIDRRLEEIDRMARTVLDKEYATREAAQAAERTYRQIERDLQTGHPRRNGEKFRKRIQDADFSDTAKQRLLDKLFQAENAKELKLAKIFSAFSAAVILAIVIGSYFFTLSGTAEYANRSVMIHGIPLLIRKVKIVEDLDFIDGFKNGLLVFGQSVCVCFLEGLADYLNGFRFGLIGNVAWTFLGLLAIVLKEILLLLARYFVTLFVAFFQKAAFPYYIGYIIGSAIPLAVSQLSFDEDKQEENVRRIKGWTVKKIVVTILLVLLSVVISAYFIFNMK